MTRDTTEEGSVETIAVLGAGRMGRGIAAVFALGGYPVTLYDVDSNQLNYARDRIHAIAEALAEYDAPPSVPSSFEANDGVRFTDSLPDALDGCTFVVEAVVEDAETKVELFECVDTHVAGDAVVASNTSSLSISNLATAVSNPERFVGTHWFNPPHVVPGVEVVRGDATGDEAVDRTITLLEDCEKRPILVERDVPGFIANRIQSAMAHEAWSLLDAGVASAEDIDAAVRSTIGFRLPLLGIFEKGDHSGLEVHHEVLRRLLPEIDRGTEPAPVLLELVEHGDVGLNAGRGVYDWSGRSADEVITERDERLLSLLTELDRGLDVQTSNAVADWTSDE